MLRKAVKKGVKTGIRVAEISLNEGVRVLRPLVRGGMLSAGEARRAARLLIRVADHHRKKADVAIQRRVTAELKRLGFVHKSQMKKRK